MKRFVVPALLPALGCRYRQPGAGIEARNAELTARHDEIWTLMGLSPAAREEFNRKEVKRARAITPDEYVAAHKRRFDAMRISPPTQKELLAAAEFAWTALHDPEADLSPEQRKTARTIQDMMKQLGGPPPGCDENLLQRAKPTP